MAVHKNYLLNDKFPKQIKNATSTSDGLMSSEDKSKLDQLFEFGLLSPVTPEKDGIMTKEDKIKLDGIEEGANNYVHPTGPEYRHVTDEQIASWDAKGETFYTNTNPVPADIGGIKKGETFNNITYDDLFTKLLYPYIEPSISGIVMTPGNTIIERGVPFNLSAIQFRVSTPSLQDTVSVHYDFYNNGNKFYGLDSINRNISTAVNLNISDNTSITVTVIDNVNARQKTFTLINYKFIYPFYHRIISETDVVNEALVKAGNKMVQDKGTKTIKFTTNNQKMLFAYPKSYGLLRTIYDANNFNVIGTFTVQEVNITGVDSVAVPYYVYTNGLSSVSNYDMQFVF